MGINLCEATAILSLKRSGAAKGNILCLGRPELFLSRREVVRLSQSFNLGWSDRAIDEATTTRHAELFLTAAGFRDVRSLDASAYEGAELIHDLNKPIPDSMVGITDFVYDGGTLEHVFDVATALSNTIKLLRVGGTLLISSAANGQCGHGFYQYSPELFYRYLEANGFEAVNVYLVGLLTPNRWRRAVDPKVLGRRVQFQTTESTQIIVIARKVSNPVEITVPQQSDYEALNWQQGETHLATQHLERTSLLGHARQIAKSRVVLPGMMLVRALGGPGFPGLYQSKAFTPIDPLTASL